ncbi:MAG: hypothetical protein B6241_05675 [Spirochaetaceae bacterium 4572_59]|nr:MAG: hypothetical protein B6241_05675 [Spirochaetaceae bacterium 4572_59]
MPAEKLINKLILILQNELNMIRQYNSECEFLHKFVVAKNWMDLEKVLQKLRILADDLSRIDEEREMFVDILKNEMEIATESSFGLLLSRFPQNEQRQINDLKRDIRHSVMILQNRINGIGRYTESQTSALKEVMDILVPDQKGKIYNRSGAASSAGAKPMLFSRHF